MHALAGEINGSIERTGGDREKPAADVVQVIAASRQTLRGLGNLLGLFRQSPAASSEKSSAADAQLSDQLMQLIIQLRAAARQKKDLETDDAIREGLGKLCIVLEDS